MDTVYYWVGGRVEGQWRRTHGNASETGLNDTLHRLRIAGYVAHKGSTKIGQPEGPPSEADFQEVA
jgi:hypothetical protein